jgi:hypothetical protein
MEPKNNEEWREAAQNWIRGGLLVRINNLGELIHASIGAGESTYGEPCQEAAYSDDDGAQVSQYWLIDRTFAELAQEAGERVLAVDDGWIWLRVGLGYPIEDDVEGWLRHRYDGAAECAAGVDA